MPLITTLFHHGAFSANDVFMTRNALVAYSVGLLGLILVKVLDAYINRVAKEGAR